MYQVLYCELGLEVLLVRDWFLQSVENFFRVCKKFSALCLYRTSRSNSHTHASGIRSWCRNAFKHIMCSMHTCMCKSWHGLRCQTELTSYKVLRNILTWCKDVNAEFAWHHSMLSKSPCLLQSHVMLMHRLVKVCTKCCQLVTQCCQLLTHFLTSLQTGKLATYHKIYQTWGMPKNVDHFGLWRIFWITFPGQQQDGARLGPPFQ